MERLLGMTIVKNQKIEPISKNVINEWEAASLVTLKLENTINNRVSYIISQIELIFNFDLDYWDYPTHTDDADGDIGLGLGDENIIRYSLIGRHPNLVIILKDGTEWGLEDECPRRWLFEDFEEELANGKILYEQKLILKKQKESEKRKSKKEEDKVLAAAAKAKLSAKELAALKRTL